MKFNESLLTSKINENLKKVKNPLDREGKADAIVEALNFFDHKSEWVNKINREEIISLITNSKDQEALCESVITKVNNTPFTKALNESKKKKETKQKLNESLTKQPLKEEKLNEGTSNFGDLDYLPLLVFITYDELEDAVDNDSDCPEYDDFDDEDDYYDALDKFKEEFYNKYYKGVGVLTDEDVDNLKFDLDNFNSETKEIAYELDVNEDGYQEYGDNLNLEDIMLTVEPGYYEGAQIYCKNDKYFDYLSEDVKNEQLERFNSFLDSIQKKYGLTKLKTAYRMSNGETGYTIVEELKHLNESEDDIYIYQLPKDANVNYIRQSINLTSANSIKLVGKVNKKGDQPGDILISGTKEDLEKFVDDYFDLKLIDNYLYKEDEFDTDLITPLKMKYSWEENLKEYYLPKDAKPYKVNGDKEYYIASYDDVDKQMSGDDKANFTIVTKRVGKDFDLGGASGLDFETEDEAKKTIDGWLNESLKEDVDNKTTFTLSTGNTPILDAGLYYSWLYDIMPSKADQPERFKEFEECVMNEALPILQDLVSKTDGFEVVSVDNYYHPRYYNYETDELDFTVKYNKDDLGDVIEQYSNNPEFIEFLKNYKSGDGFISFYADNKDEFITQEPQKSVSQIIRFNVSQEDIEKANEDLYYNVSDCGFYNEDEMEENLKEDTKDSEKILQRKMGALFMPPRNYGIKKKRPRYVYEVYWYTDEDWSDDPIFKKFPSNKARQIWYEQHKDDPDKFGMCADLDGYNVNENYDVTIKDKKTGETKTLKNRTDNQLDKLKQNKNIDIVSTEPVEENLKENKLQEKNEYFAYMDKDYANILDSNVDVYDVKQFVLDDSNNEYRTHYTDEYAIIVAPNGKGCVVDYEAVGQDFDSIDSEIEFGVEKNEDNEYTDEQGNKHKTLNIFATHTLKTTPKEVMEKAPKKTMKYRDFFRKYNYNDRCAFNFKDMVKYLKANGLQESCNSKKKRKLKEGYIGQTLNDFFYDCVDPEVIETVSIWGEDDEIYSGDYDGAIDEFGDNEFIEFDCGMDKVVINVDTNEEYQVTDYFIDVQDFVDVFNGDEIEVFDINEGKILFSGDKYDLPDDVAEKIFVSFDAPKFISINIEEDGDYDESLKETKKKSKFLEAHYNNETGEVEPDLFYGVPEVEFIWHGEWADPEVAYKGNVYSYTDVEDALYDDFKDRVQSGDIVISTEGYEDLPRGTREEQAEEDAFYDFVNGSPDIVYELLNDLEPIDTYEESLKEGYSIVDLVSGEKFGNFSSADQAKSKAYYYATNFRTKVAVIDDANNVICGYNKEKEIKPTKNEPKLTQDDMNAGQWYESLKEDKQPLYRVVRNPKGKGYCILKRVNEEGKFINDHSKETFDTPEEAKKMLDNVDKLHFHIDESLKEDVQNINAKIYYEEDGEPIIVFKSIGDRKGNFDAYVHNGQHTVAAPDYVKTLKKANLNDQKVKDLIAEYESNYPVKLNLKEDTIKKDGKWVNKGNTGKTHGEFKTKKEADKQRAAMFAGRKPNAKWGK